MKYLFVGGGTGGPTTALIAIAEELQKKNPAAELLLLGDKGGIGEHVLEASNMPYSMIHAGKFRRYASIKNITDIFRTMQGMYEAWKVLRSWHPDIIIAAGSFVSVPVVLVGYILRIPILIHQQDVAISLTNKVLKRFATHITVAFEISKQYFPAEKTSWTGNPVRKKFLEGKSEQARRDWNLRDDMPTLLVMGGGGGAEPINHIMEEIGPRLLQYVQIIHITGPQKTMELRSENYHQTEFMKEGLADALAVADVVISRAGMGSLTECAVLAKATIVIPIPKSHQEDNARYLTRQKAVIVLDQRETHLQKQVEKILEIIKNEQKRKELGKNLAKSMRVEEGGKNIVKIIETMIQENV